MRGSNEEKKGLRGHAHIRKNIIIDEILRRVENWNRLRYFQVRQLVEYLLDL